MGRRRQTPPAPPVAPSPDLVVRDSATSRRLLRLATHEAYTHLYEAQRIANAADALGVPAGDLRRSIDDTGRALAVLADTWGG